MIVNVTEADMQDTEHSLQHLQSESESKLSTLEGKISSGVLYLQQNESVIQSRIDTYESELRRLKDLRDSLKNQLEKTINEIDRLNWEIDSSQNTLSQISLTTQKNGKSEYSSSNAERAREISKRISQMQTELNQLNEKSKELSEKLKRVEEAIEEVQNYLEEVLYRAREEHELASTSLNQMGAAIDRAFGNWMPALTYIAQKVKRLKEYLEEFNAGTFTLNRGERPNITAPYFAHTPIVTMPLPSGLKRKEEKPKEPTPVSIPPKMKWATHDTVEIIGQYSSKSELESDIGKLPFLCTIRVPKIISTHLSCFQNTLELDDFMKRLRFSAKRTMFGTRYVDGKGYIYFVGRE